VWTQLLRCAYDSLDGLPIKIWTSYLYVFIASLKDDFVVMWVIIQCIGCSEWKIP
jgi:hypothetical protein